uniref:Uncharacterized protein n=1 Tax=Guillardia theta (strain CCMP2712) TaxID=905079 RepID=A0A0C3SHT4_GUITC
MWTQPRPLPLESPADRLRRLARALLEVAKEGTSRLQGTQKKQEEGAGERMQQRREGGGRKERGRTERREPAPKDEELGRKNEIIQRDRKEEREEREEEREDEDEEEDVEQGTRSEQKEGKDPPPRKTPSHTPSCPQSKFLSDFGSCPRPSPGSSQGPRSRSKSKSPPPGLRRVINGIWQGAHKGSGKEEEEEEEEPEGFALIRDKYLSRCLSIHPGLHEQQSPQKGKANNRGGEEDGDCSCASSRMLDDDKLISATRKQLQLAASAIKEALEAAEDAKGRLSRLRNSTSSSTNEPAKKLSFSQLGSSVQQGRGGRLLGEDHEARWKEHLRSESSEAVQEARKAFNDAVLAGEEVIVSWMQFCSQLREVDFRPSKETQQLDYLGRRASSATKRRKEEVANKMMHSLLESPNETDIESSLVGE